MKIQKIWVFLGAAVLFFFWFLSIANKIVTLDEEVKSSWSQVENVYQRRFDLIPNLVQTVKGYAKHEADVLIRVTQARSKVGQIQVNSPQDLQKFEASQGEITQALSRLMVISEKYPDLKANRNFLELQSQLEGTENRISVERGRFNEASRNYNSYIRKIPNSFIASLRGASQKPYFEAGKAAQEGAPKVEF